MAPIVSSPVATALLQKSKVGFDFDAALDEALHAHGMKRETFAALLGVSGSRLSQMAHHDGRLSLQALARAAEDAEGKAVVAALVRAWAEAVGLEQIDAVAQAFTEASRLLVLRMAKAPLRAPQETRRTA